MFPLHLQAGGGKGQQEANDRHLVLSQVSPTEFPDSGRLLLLPIQALVQLLAGSGLLPLSLS